MSGRVGDDRSRAGRDLGRKCERVRLEHEAFVGRHHLVLVMSPRPGPGYEELPHPRIAERPHRVHTTIPRVPVPHDPDRLGVRRPNCEGGPARPLVSARVSAQHLPQAAVAALVEQVQVEVAQRRPVPVGVVEHEGRRTRSAVHRLEPVAAAPGRAAPSHSRPGGPGASGPAPGLARSGAGAGDDHVHFACARAERPDDAAVAAEHRVRVVVAALHQQLDLLGVKTGSAVCGPRPGSARPASGCCRLAPSLGAACLLPRS